MVDLAATAPNDPGARDTLLWVLDKPGMGPGGPYSDEFARAVLLLLRHHSDDSEVARLGLGLNNVFTPARDILLEGLYVQAKSRESKGLARASARPVPRGESPIRRGDPQGRCGWSAQGHHANSDV